MQRLHMGRLNSDHSLKRCVNLLRLRAPLGVVREHSKGVSFHIARISFLSHKEVGATSKKLELTCSKHGSKSSQIDTSIRMKYYKESVAAA